MPLVRELMPGAAIVAPRGDVSEHGALRFFRRRGEGVYDMADLAARTAAMAGFVEAHAAIAAPSRVIGLGYSNGANILASVIFAAAGAVRRRGADASADPLDAGAGAGARPGADHRRRARPDLPARGDPGARGLVPRRRARR